MKRPPTQNDPRARRQRANPRTLQVSLKPGNSWRSWAGACDRCRNPRPEQQGNSFRDGVGPRDPVAHGTRADPELAGCARLR